MRPEWIDLADLAVSALLAVARLWPLAPAARKRCLWMGCGCCYPVPGTT